ncbi:AI-2E family transporter [Actinocorallia lasiicapitis]
MPSWLPRAFVLAGATVLVFLAGLWALERLQGLLTLVLMALFLAFAIEPAVNYLASRGMSRGLATGMIFILLAGAAGAFLALLGTLLVDQITNMVNNAPRTGLAIVEWVNQTFHTELSPRDITRRLTSLQSVATGQLSLIAGNVWGIGTHALGILFQGLGLILFTFYFAADGPRLRRAVCALLPPQRQLDVLRAWEIAVDKTGGYLYSRALLAVVSAAAHTTALSLLGVPNAVTLGLFVGLVSQFVPTVGTYIAGIVPVLVALAQSPATALWTLLFIVAYQQFENYVLQPKITARSMDMHPAVAFALVLGGAALFGAPGALLALPAGASIQAFLSAYVRRYDVADHPLTTP